MATFISVPLKKCEEVDLVKPLSKFITSIYAVREDQTNHIRAVEELNKLRKSALGRQLDRHERSLEILLRYYDQLCAAEPKFPFSENQLCLTFTWKDAFDKGSLFSGPAKLALANLRYEKTCVLFNIGALASQIASEQNLDNDEGLKTAAKLYQLASGAFSHIKATVLSALSQEPTADITPDTTSVLSHIMLAQAQEVVFLKATADKMKSAVIAKLANQAADLYAEACRQFQSKENLPKEISSILAAKHCVMLAYAEYHQSTLAKQKQQFGEEIARLQNAISQLKTVTSRYNEYVNVKDLSDKITRALSAAKKDNDFIYHDRVPETKDLDRIGKASLVKPTAIQMPISQKFTDLFQKMVPLAVQHSLSIYNQRKAEMVNRLIGSMREASSLCSGVLASLNLPAALEDFSGDSVPPSILEKSRSIIQQGGQQSIEGLMKNLPDMLQRNKEILDEALRMLNVEESTDCELRAKFGQRWNRTPSGELYKPLRTDGMNFNSLLDNTQKSDSLLPERYAIHSPMIALLCKSEAELRAAIPSAHPAKTLQGSEVVSDLRTQLDHLDEMKKERERIESGIRSAQFDMTATFLSALAQDGTISEEALSTRQLESTYGGYSQEVQKSLQTQQELLTNVQTLHQKFSGMKQTSTESMQREEVMMKLASAYDSYMEISTSLREGTKFYADLTVVLLKFQNNCSDIVFARKTEQDDLMKEIQLTLAQEPSAPSIPPATTNQASASTPSRPTPAPRTVYSQNKPTPPPRPPPPSIPLAAKSAPPSSTSQPQASSTPAASPGTDQTSSTTSVGTPGLTSQAQGPPYQTYQGYPGFFPMPMGWSPFPYGQYNMPYLPYQSQGQVGYPAASPPQPQNQPNYP
ncbi:programmed cell death 6-interacting protein-like [Conger conger]|uniref:programmed cell death 6-interacting protein-like n=1 Tax=Conger conger TaxID=82655 RepID=UPI002A59CEB8|nr:programmed cell death 6-interacting protein-like [Conger conger]